MLTEARVRKVWGTTRVRVWERSWISLSLQTTLAPSTGEDVSRELLGKSLVTANGILPICVHKFKGGLNTFILSFPEPKYAQMCFIYYPESLFRYSL